MAKNCKKCRTKSALSDKIKQTIDSDRVNKMCDGEHKPPIPAGHENIEDEGTGDLTATVKGLFLTSKYSDLTIKLKDQEFKVHKAILGGQSEYFNKIFNRDWKENHENTIELSGNDDPVVIEAMIRHMYGLDFENCGINRDHTSPLLFSIKVYQAADYYRVPHLKKPSRESAEKAAKTCWKLKDYPTAISEAYRTIAGDTEIQNMLIEVSREHIKELLEVPGFLEVLHETKDFAADLSKALASKGVPASESGLTKYECPNCDSQWKMVLCAGSRSFTYCPYCKNSYNWDQYKC